MWFLRLFYKGACNFPYLWLEIKLSEENRLDNVDLVMKI